MRIVEGETRAGGRLSGLASLASLASAVAVAVVLLVAAPPPIARAADGVVDTATTTYEVVPDKGVLGVRVELRVRNEVPSGTQLVPCTRLEDDPVLGPVPVPSTCEQAIDYFVNGTYVWVERTARNIRVSADRGTVSRAVEQRLDDYVGYRLTFPAIGRGESRRITVRYEVPGGKPRSATPTRIGRAYVNFCVIANGLDGGVVRVVVPPAFEIGVWPEPMTSTAGDDGVVYQSGPIADTTAFYRCLEGTNEAGFARSEVTSPSGRVVVVEAWPEDAGWREAVGAEVAAAAAALEELVGRGLPGSGPIAVRQVSDSELGDYAGTFDAGTGIARISETYTEPGVVAHELSHAWFNLDTFAARWLSEGLAQWVERVSPTAGAPCTEPGRYPGRGSPDLDEWAPPGPRATDAERSILAYNYDASCWITTALADRMGEERMGEVIGALLDGRAAYGDEPTDRRPGDGPVDWRTFLDVVDELGLVPAGVADLEYAQDLLLDYGVAEVAALRGRAEARAAYHALAADLGGWAMPDAIRAPLETWSFADARARLATAGETLALVRDADATLEGIDATGGPAKAAFEEALNAADLAEAEAIAADQAAAAADVADALAVLAEPLDTIEEIGMWGVELEPVAAAGVAAARAADAGAAATAADEIRGQLARAPEVGTQRVAFGAGGALAALLLLAGVVLLVRRHRRLPMEAVGAAAPIPEIPLPGTVEPSLGGDPATEVDGPMPIDRSPPAAGERAELGHPADPAP